MAESTVKIMTPQMVYWKFGDGVNRSKNIPTLIPVRHRAIRHSGCVTKLRWSPFEIFEGRLIYW